MAKVNNKKDDFSKKFRVNDEIRTYGNVRIVGDGIESKIVTLNEAKTIADSMELDLVEIQRNSDTPIVRICNYEKMLYELKKNSKKNKPQGKPMKEIQLSVNIASNDLKTKANHARKFLEEGSRVKVVLSMRGRELARRDANKKSILEFIELLDDISIPESMPKDEGNRTIVYLKRKNHLKQ